MPLSPRPCRRALPSAGASSLVAGRLLSGRTGCGWGGSVWLLARVAHIWWGRSVVGWPVGRLVGELFFQHADGAGLVRRELQWREGCVGGGGIGPSCAHIWVSGAVRGCVKFAVASHAGNTGGFAHPCPHVCPHVSQQDGGYSSRCPRSQRRWPRNLNAKPAAPTPLPIGGGRRTFGARQASATKPRTSDPQGAEGREDPTPGGRDLPPSPILSAAK